jgi:hypothetical protein
MRTCTLYRSQEARRDAILRLLGGGDDKKNARQQGTQQESIYPCSGADPVSQRKEITLSGGVLLIVCRADTSEDGGARSSVFIILIF